MGKVKSFLVRKNIRPSAKLYFVDAMGSMALGLFATLLIGTIFETLGQHTGWAGWKNPLPPGLPAPSLWPLSPSSWARWCPRRPRWTFWSPR